MKKFIYLSIILITSTLVKAQNDVDALRYSRLNVGGTARFMSMGGAFGALGADFSTLSNNPAGIALYKKNEFTFTPSMFTASTKSVYLNESREDIKYNFNMSNMGMIFSYKTDASASSDDWQNVNFGFGFNRYNNFNNRILVEGNSLKESLIDGYIAKANGTKYDKLDPYDTDLAWNVYLLDTLRGVNKYRDTFPSGGVAQRKYINTKGSMNEIVLSFGGNYSDKLYLGATFGIPMLRYIELSDYMETRLNDTMPGFKNFVLREDLTTTGTGVNFKAGIIYRATDWLRFGASFSTPTFYTLTDEWSKKMESTFDTSNYEMSSPKGYSDPNYNLTTPLRAIGSIAFIIGKYGVVSGDYEFIDYSEARLHSNTYTYIVENTDIQDKYNATSNFRIGTEWRIDPFVVRGGYALYASPYKSNINDGARSTISGGIGVREKGYFIDFAYVYSKMTEDYYLYSTAKNAARNTFTTNNFLLTVGFKFD